MKLCWLTDVHLNFLNKERRFQFYQSVADTKADAALLTGDIAEAPSICEILTEFNQQTQLHTYFVLGNHDYYFGTIEDVRTNVKELTKINSSLTYLSDGALIPLKEGVLLVGQDAWADGRNGDFSHSPVRLNDSRCIVDLKQMALLNQRELQMKMQALADADAQKLSETLTQAVAQNVHTIYIASHVPPFSQACWYDGQPSNADWVPYFSCKATGDLLDRVAADHTDIQFVVLCGHTHTAHTYERASNLLIKVGAADYYYPDIEDLLEI